jgi:NADH:ubiquinone oxidoreductase subunit 5 (subunit L)/multisubunit Na+/H+ antiporter MnhA subunit
MLKSVATGTVLGLIAFILCIVLGGQALGPLLLTPASSLLGVFVLIMGWLVAAYSARNLRGQRRQVRYGVLLALAIGALWLMVVADSFVLMAAGWTVSGLAVAGLVAHSNTPTARSAARRVAGRLLIGDVALWAAVTLLLVDGMTARSELDAAGWVVPALLAFAGVIRSALLPTWRWLPLTAEAPSPVSGLLHAGVVNGMGLLAILLWPLFAAAPGVLLALVVVGGITAVAGTAAMRVRPDVKGKLASSTSAQMGYMTVQVGLGLPAFAMLHLIGHGFYKAWLFLRAGGASRRPVAPSMPQAPRWAPVRAGRGCGAGGGAGGSRLAGVAGRRSRAAGGGRRCGNIGPDRVDLAGPPDRGAFLSAWTDLGSDRRAGWSLRVRRDARRLVTGASRSPACGRGRRRSC